MSNLACCGCKYDLSVCCQDELDKLYEEIGSLTGEDDGWMDDDFGLSGKLHKPPPPYPVDDNQQQPGMLHSHP